MDLSHVETMKRQRVKLHYQWYKYRLSLAFILALAFLLFWYFFNGNSGSSKLDYNLKPINNPKHNAEGNYLPFYGYTSLAVCDRNQGLEKFEKFLQVSILHKYYSPLPVSSYHMTLFDIWCAKRKPIELVRKWMEKNNVKTINTSYWLPREALKKEFNAASAAASKIPPFIVKLVWNVRYKKPLTIKVEILEENARKKVEEFRQTCMDVFGNVPRFEYFHITLGYQYKHWKYTDDAAKVEEDLEKLRKMVESTKPIRLRDSDVYIFQSMLDFIPYSKRSKYP